jgi:hypothetical protein
VLLEPGNRGMETASEILSKTAWSFAQLEIVDQPLLTALSQSVLATC